MVIVSQCRQDHPRSDRQCYEQSGDCTGADARRSLAVIALEVEEQLTNAPRIDDGMVSHGDRCQGVNERVGRVTHGGASGDRVAIDRRRDRECAMRGLMQTRLLDSLPRAQQVSSCGEVIWLQSRSSSRGLPGAGEG